MAAAAARESREKAHSAIATRALIYIERHHAQRQAYHWQPGRLSSCRCRTRREERRPCPPYASSSVSQPPATGKTAPRSGPRSLDIPRRQRGTPPSTAVSTPARDSQLL